MVEPLPRLRMVRDEGVAVEVPVPFDARISGFSVEDISGPFLIDEEDIPPSKVQTGYSCIAHAICKALEIDDRLSDQDPTAYDPECYHRCVIDLPFNEAPGSIFQVVNQVSKRRVPIRETSGPLDLTRCDPIERRLHSFGSYKIGTMNDLKIWMKSNNRPAIAVLSISEAFSNHRGSREYVEESTDLFEHCVTIIGFDDEKVMILNSQGTQWGIQGKGTAWINAESCGLFGATTSAVYRLD